MTDIKKSYKLSRRFNDVINSILMWDHGISDTDEIVNNPLDTIDDRIEKIEPLIRHYVSENGDETWFDYCNGNTSRIRKIYNENKHEHIIVFEHDMVVNDILHTKVCHHVYNENHTEIYFITYDIYPDGRIDTQEWNPLWSIPNDRLCRDYIVFGDHRSATSIEYIPEYKTFDDINAEYGNNIINKMIDSYKESNK